MDGSTLIGILIPFLGTSLGAAMVFVLKNTISDNLQKILTGFAAGVMVAASFWSLLQPALESSEGMGTWAFVPAAVGFLVGLGFLLLLDETTPHMHMNNEEEGPKTGLKRTTKLILAVTLHNIPEGMAVGVVYAGFLAGSAGISAAGALALSLGIAIQNFPEGAIVSMPLRAEGMDKGRTFLYGVLSGVVEPIAAACTICGGGSRAGDAVSSRLCRRCHDVCGGGGTDSGDVRGKTLQLRDDRIFPRICTDDDPGRGTGVKMAIAFLTGHRAGYIIVV